MKLTAAVVAALFLGLGCRAGDAQLVYQPTIITGTPVVDGGDAGMTIVTIPPPDAGEGTPLNGCTPVGSQESCYTGPPSTIGADGCHPGITTCEDGGYWGNCAGESIPTPLLTDIVFILDNTDDTCVNGMGVPEFVEVQEAALNFIYAYPEVNFRWGVVTMPGCGHVWPGSTDAGYSLFQPLTGEAGGVHALGVQCVAGSSDDPECADAPIPAYTVLLDQLQGGIIPWDLGAQHFIIFFTSAGPLAPAAVNDIMEASLDGGVETLMFISPQYAQSCGGCGLLYPLGTDLAMLTRLENAFTTVLTCQQQ